MKCDDGIKHRALEKLNELNNAKGDLQNQQYIDGILKYHLEFIKKNH